MAAVKVDRNKDGNMTGTLTGALGEAGKWTSKVVVDEDGVKAYAANGGEPEQAGTRSRPD